MSTSLKEVQRKLDLSLEDLAKEEKVQGGNNGGNKQKKNGKGEGKRARAGGVRAAAPGKPGAREEEDERQTPRSPAGDGPGGYPAYPGSPYGPPPPHWGYPPHGAPPATGWRPLPYSRPMFDPHRMPYGVPPRHPGMPLYDPHRPPPPYYGHHHHRAPPRPCGHLDGSGRPQGPPPPGPEAHPVGVRHPEERAPLEGRPPTVPLDRQQAHVQLTAAPIVANTGFQVRLNNVPPELTARDLAEAFGEVSTSRVESVDLLRDERGRATGECVVVFSNMQDAQNAVRRYHGGDLNGRKLLAAFEGEVSLRQ